MLDRGTRFAHVDNWQYARVAVLSASTPATRYPFVQGTGTTGSRLLKWLILYFFTLDGAEAKIKTMRVLVEPPPSSHCPSCGGILLFKLHRSAKFTFDSDSEIFICEKCGQEHRYAVRPSFRTPADSRLDPRVGGRGIN
jgi:hypothetical protein